MIKKSDVQKIHHEHVQAEAKKLEGRIDQQLKDEFLPLIVYVGGLPRDAIKSVADRYRVEGGYEVHELLDGKDGPARLLIG